MKNLRSKIFFFALFMVTAVMPVFAAETTPADGKAAQAVTNVTPKVDYKDAFLAFALEKAKDYSGKAEMAVSKAVDFTVKEAPEVAREFLVWRAWYNGMVFFIPVGFVVFFLFLLTLNWAKADFGDYTFNWHAACSLIGMVGGIISFIVTMTNLPNLFALIQILVAPRVYMIEQVMELVRK